MQNALFAPARIGSILLPNRVIRSATHEGLADAKGAPTERLVKRYLQLARGGVGAIITGYAGIAQSGKSSNLNMLMMDRDSLIGAHRSMVAAVHACDTPIILQLAHCGRQTRAACTGEPTLAPSALRDAVFRETLPSELTEREIEEIIKAFVCAVERSKEAGFDGVQLHAAHGYLLSSFLSAYSNRRRDRWGGLLENRFRIVAEIYARARRQVGDFPILAKINGHDGRPGGMRVGEAVEVARMLERAGCAAVEVSCGTMEDGFHTVRTERVPVDAAFQFFFPLRALPRWARALARPIVALKERPAKPVLDYNLSAAAAIKANVAMPVIAVGGIRSLARMEEILASAQADFVALCRPFIREPSFVRNLLEGRQTESRCTSCAICALAQERMPLRCHAGAVRA